MCTVCTRLMIRRLPSISSTIPQYEHQPQVFCVTDAVSALCMVLPDCRAWYIVVSSPPLCCFGRTLVFYWSCGIPDVCICRTAVLYPSSLRPAIDQTSICASWKHPCSVIKTPHWFFNSVTSHYDRQTITLRPGSNDVSFSLWHDCYKRPWPIVDKDVLFMPRDCRVHSMVYIRQCNWIHTCSLASHLRTIYATSLCDSY